MKVIRLLLFIILWAMPFCSIQGQIISNTLPMYGEVEKSEEHKKLDERFINEIINLQGSRDKGCKQFIQRGWAYFYHDSLEISMKRFNQAWLLNPDIPDVYFGFAALTEIKGNSIDAERYYRIGLEKDIKHDRAVICYKKIADCKEQLKDFKGAISAYEKVQLIEPTNHLVFTRLGNLYTQIGNNEIALVNYSKAIELDPNFISSYVNRGDIKFRNGDISGAKNDFERCVELDPKSGEFWRRLGICKSLEKDLNAACSDFEKAAKLGDTEAKEIMDKICSSFKWK